MRCRSTIPRCLWHRAKARNALPGPDEIKRALDHVGYKNIALDETNRTISFKKEEMSIDMGGIAKGYATDRAIKVLEDAGIKNAPHASSASDRHKD